MSKSKRSRDRRDVGEDLDVELFDEDAAPDAGGKGGKKPSLSKQLAALDGTEQAKSRKGRGQGVQSLLRFMSPVSSPATPATPVPGASAEAGAVAFVPHKLRGSALEFVNRESEKDAGLESARKHRQGKGSAKKSRTLDPDELPGEAWVFFRAAKEGENSKYVYCKAHGFKSQTKCKLSRARVKISKDKKGPFLKLSNAESHLQGCHEEWWRAVAAAARNGKDPKKTFLDLCGADTPLPRQRNISVVRTVRPGQLEKELALLLHCPKDILHFLCIGKFRKIKNISLSLYKELGTAFIKRLL